MRFALLLAAVLLLTSIEAQEKSRAQRTFETWDLNGDGKLIRQELPRQLRGNFEKVDTNGDKSISLEEHTKFVTKRNLPDEQKRRKMLQVPDSIRKLADQDYAGTGNPRQALDLYLPKNPKKEKVPLLVFIHGGGWKSGDKNSGGGRLIDFVKTGEFAGASIAYRLSPEAQWPAQIHDCKAAMRWLRAHADQYGYDAERIAVWGTSAGGHLVAMLGVSNGVEALEGEIGPHKEVSSKVHCVVNYFGPAKFLTMNDHPSNIDHLAGDSPESMLIGASVKDHPDKANAASPQTYVTSDDVPSLIVHGTQDKLVPYQQSVEFEKALEAVGVETTLLTVRDGGHGAGFGPAVNQTVDQFLRFHLLGATEKPADREVKAGE